MRKFILGTVAALLLGIGILSSQSVDASTWHGGVPGAIRNTTFELNTKKSIGTTAYSFTNHSVKIWAAGIATSSSSYHQIHYKMTGHNAFYLKGGSGHERDYWRIKVINPTHLYLYDHEIYHHYAPYKYAGKANIKRLPRVPKDVTDP